ncbi:hypothetical protein K7X08_037378 [Anisodus acutangulus]|uniref:FAD linked oxidase N-terminal domain-containing protein n=1 Tax=Anisodus acutangulus TaxID=402998 RepID=A0A9Q1N2F0_9SOLA|nr:hypothetical protein K7X08_037378 [Anisodus acutangulus]
MKTARFLSVDKEKKRVIVQAGIRVQQLVDAIKEYGITLQNFPSIREQQIGGIVQVGAHGTGARLPPIDEQVISMKLKSLFSVLTFFMFKLKDIKKNHKKFLSENKHVKYLHIPYTDAVVVVTCNPISSSRGLPSHKPKYTTEEALQYVRDLYQESLKKYR